MKTSFILTRKLPFNMKPLLNSDAKINVFAGRVIIDNIKMPRQDEGDTARLKLPWWLYRKQIQAEWSSKEFKSLQCHVNFYQALLEQ